MPIINSDLLQPREKSQDNMEGMDEYRVAELTEQFSTKWRLLYVGSFDEVSEIR